MEEIELIKIEIGKRFPLFQESVEKLKGTDGAFFEANELDQGYNYCIQLANISFMDKKAFRNEKISMRILQGDHGMVLPIMKWEKSFMFEMSFDPTLYDDERAFQFTESNNLLTIFLIESNTGELKAIRQCNFPLKMIQICREAWGRAMLEINYSERFTEWMKRMSVYPMKTLWDRATKVGDMGETYNLEDIIIPNQYKPNNETL